MHGKIVEEEGKTNEGCNGIRSTVLKGWYDTDTNLHNKNTRHIFLPLPSHIFKWMRFITQERKICIRIRSHLDVCYTFHFACIFFFFFFLCCCLFVCFPFNNGIMASERKKQKTKKRKETKRKWRMFKKGEEKRFVYVTVTLLLDMFYYMYFSLNAFQIKWSFYRHDAQCITANMLKWN